MSTKRTREINTSSSVDTRKAVQKEATREICRKNLFIIRELFNLLCIKSGNGNISDLYFYLLGDKYNEKNDKSIKQCFNTFNTYIHNGMGDLSEAFSKLENCGIDKKYFQTNEFEMDEKIKNFLSDYMDNNGDKKLFDFRREFIVCYETIMNDGVPLANIVIDIWNDIYNRPLQKARAITDTILSSSIIGDYTSKKLYDIYASLATNAPNYTQGKKIKSIYPMKKGNDNVKMNLSIIRELICFFAELDNIGNMEKKFYKFLDETKESYEKILQTGFFDNVRYYRMLSPFSYPAGIFRGDNPTLIQMCSSLIEYLENKNMDKLRETLRCEMLYAHNTKNFVLVMSTLKLYYAINDSPISTEVDFHSYQSFCNSNKDGVSNL